MSELDGIVKKYIDTARGNLHGATFIAIDRKGLVSTIISISSDLSHSSKKLVSYLLRPLPPRRLSVAVINLVLKYNR